MTRQAIIIVGVTISMGLWTPVHAADPTYAVPAGVSNQPFMPVTPATGDPIGAIEQAQTPSQAVGAYARGLAVDRGDVRLYQAYMRKLIALDLPDMAVTPARTVLAAEPDDGLALAVLTLDAARRGDLRVATTDMILAATWALDNAFVQHVAGQILAWYDSTSDHSMIAASVISNLEALRPQLQSKPVCVNAYVQALQAYKQRAAAGPSVGSSAASPLGNNYDSAAVAPPVVSVPQPTYDYGSDYYAAPPATYSYGYPYYNGSYYGSYYPYVPLSFGFGYGYRGYYGHGYGRGGYVRGGFSGGGFSHGLAGGGGVVHGFSGGVAHGFSGGGGGHGHR